MEERRSKGRQVWLGAIGFALLALVWEGYKAFGNAVEIGRASCRERVCLAV